MRALSRFRAPLLGLVAVLGLTGAGFAYTHFAVTGRVTTSVTMTETAASNFDGVSASISPAITYNQSYTSGTASGQFNTKWCDERDIVASGADTLDLVGILTTEFGATASFATIKVISIEAATSNTNNVWVGGGAVNRFNTFLKDSSVIVIQPGYNITLAGPGTGYTVTANTGDDLLVKNSAGSTPVTYQICVAGVAP